MSDKEFKTELSDEQLDAVSGGVSIKNVLYDGVDAAIGTAAKIELKEQSIAENRKEKQTIKSLH